MNENFKYNCTRRSSGAPPEIGESIPLGAGSGGDDADGSKFVGTEKTLVLSGNHVAIQAQPPSPPSTPGPSLITILASDMTTMEGRVEMHGAQSVRITSGGLPGPSPRMHSESTNGVDIAVGEAQEIIVKRGMIPGVDQVIQISPGSMMIDGGVGSITIQSLTNITIQVANGISSITLTPMGIVMQGPLIMIN